MGNPNASGTVAGFLYQFERVILRLATAGSEVVGIAPGGVPEVCPGRLTKAGKLVVVDMA